MITFIILAAVLTFAAVAAVAVPLLRRSGAAAQASWTAMGVTALLVVGAASLYVTFSNWPWHPASAQAADAPHQKISHLVAQVQRHPDDLKGWLTLGQSYLGVREYHLAGRAYAHANHLAGGKNVDALLGLAEAFMAESDNGPDARVGKLIERALKIAPLSPRALFFGAMSALRSNDLPLARRRFQDLVALNPPAKVKTLLQQQIATIDQQLGAAQEKPASANTAGQAPAGSPRPPEVRVRVQLSPKLHVAPSSKTPLFVIVRDPKRPGLPLAVKRLTSLPQTVELTPADSMIRGRGFSNGQSVEVVARIARSGSAIAHSGDPFGETGYKVGQDGLARILIDHVTP